MVEVGQVSRGTFQENLRTVYRRENVLSFAYLTYICKRNVSDRLQSERCVIQSKM